MRPIIITSLTLMAGAWAIIFDPIFQGMAVSLLFGAGVATLMAVLIIPLGCISLRKRFYMEEATDSAEMVLNPKYEEIEGEAIAAADEAVQEYKTPLWMRIYSGIIGLVGWIILIVRSIFIMLKMAVGAILDKFGGGEPPSPPPATSPPSPPSGSPPPAPPSGGVSDSSTSARQAAPIQNKTVEETVEETVDLAPEPAPAESKQATSTAGVTQDKAAGGSKKTGDASKKTSTVKRSPEKKLEKKKLEKKKLEKKKLEKNKNGPSKSAAIASKAEVVEQPAAAEEAEPVKKTVPTKKAPSKKTSPRGRRGIRLKIDTD
jgi:hypothetical protein